MSTLGEKLDFAAWATDVANALAARHTPDCRCFECVDRRMVEARAGDTAGRPAPTFARS